MKAVVVRAPMAFAVEEVSAGGATFGRLLLGATSASRRAPHRRPAPAISTAGCR
ncbi:hypothetical protein [Caldilinea sp.]|uniref:hypothetical protein n=1 Tax=Caldilinea sp. TaxID=2293560 RepID=UPI002B5378B0|nr:hypothetical protein [Anaerolineales bacterium]HQY90164.1 hypothetical protein [Caldilinea sp.]